MKSKQVNKCEIGAVALSTQGCIEYTVFCADAGWNPSSKHVCKHYQSRSKNGSGGCKFYSGTFRRECTNLEAKKEAAKKIIAGLKKYILEK